MEQITIKINNWESYQDERPVKVCKESTVSTKDENTTQLSEVATGDDLEPEKFPKLGNISSAFVFQFIPRPVEIKPPEFVYVPYQCKAMREDAELKIELTMANWGMTWEAAQLRHNFISDLDGLPDELSWLKNHEGDNIYLLPKGGPFSKYYAYCPLYHLLPQPLLKSYGLPALKGGLWPYMTSHFGRERELPLDFADRLATAFAHYIWPLLNSGSRLSAFSDREPLHLLAHNLDFWMPYAYQMAEARMRNFPRIKMENKTQAATFEKLRKSLPPEIQVDRPLMGGTIWQGEAEAGEATKELIGCADASGRLREIIDAIQSNRVEEDFSHCWSYAREDFERKLYHKRTKLKIKFIEIDDTIPVLGPESEIHERLLWDQFLGILNEKERTVVVLLRSGVTKLKDIAQHLGYANHSPVSKALTRLAKKAKHFMNL
jgi:hypothetical protein